MVVVPALPFVQVAGETSNVSVSITPGASTKTTDAYSPNPVSIDVDDTVIWTNNDPPNIHTAVSGTPSGGPDGKFGGTPEAPFSEIIAPRATSNHTFTESGEYPYYCVLHPSMVGRVIVGQAEDSITVRTDKSIYEIGDDVKITGQVEPPNPDLQVLLRITNEDGELVRVDLASVEEDGRYSYEFHIGGSLFEPNKSYSVNVAYRSAVAEIEFSISRAEGGCEGLVPTILGTDRDDVLVGTNGNDVIDGLRGNDVIRGQDGDDIICGGPGFDEIRTGEGDDRAYGGRGNDELYGDLGNDRLWGGTGWDKLFGGAGDDTIFGGKGNDMLQGEEGNDQLDGQAGEDVLDGVPDDDDNVPPGNRNIILDSIDDEYQAGDAVEISGTIDNVDDNEDEVTIRIDGPDSESETVTLDDDAFDWDYDIPDPADDGIYSIEVEYDSESVFTYFFIDDNNDLVVVTDNETYELGDTVQVEGEVNDPQLDVEEVEITVFDPSGETVSGMDEEAVDLDGDSFETDFDLDDDDDARGIYAILVTYNNDDDEEGYAIFEVEGDGGSSGSTITASLSKTNYRQGEEVRITGEVEDVEVNDDVVLFVRDPDGDEVFSDAKEPESDRSFEFEFTLEDDAKTGPYEVTLSYIQADNEKVLLFSVSTAGSHEGVRIIDEDASWVGDVKMASRGENIYLTWAKNTGDLAGAVFFTSSNDNGNNFGPITRITQDSGPDAIVPHSADIIVSDNGTIYLGLAAFSEESQQDLQIYFTASYDGGKNFLPIKKMKTPKEAGRAYAFEFRIAASGDHVYVLWQNDRAALLAASHDEGRTFEPTKIIAKDVVEVAEIAANDNIVYVVWASDVYEREDRYKIFLAMSSDNGASFGNPNELSIDEGSSEGYEIYPHIALNYEGEIFVSWLREGSHQEYVLSKVELTTDRELLFGQPTIIDQGSDPCSLRSWGPQIGFSGGDFVYVVYNEQCWREDHPNGVVGKVTIVVSKDGGLSFEKPKSIADDEFGAYGERFVAIDDKIFVVWVRENYSEEYGCCNAISYNIMLSSSSDFGETFSDAKALYDTDGYGLSVPEIAVNQNNLNVGWTSSGYDGAAVLLSTTETQAVGSIPSSLSASLFKTSYIQGDTVLMTIDVDNGDLAEDLSIIVEDINGTRVLEENIEPTNDGFFTFAFDLSDDAAVGQYKATIRYMGNAEVLGFDVGAQFAPWINLSNNPGSSFDPTSAASGNHVYIAWLDGSTPLRNWGLFFAKSDDSGNTFSDAEQISLVDDTAYWQAMTADGDDIYLTWLGADNPDGAGMLSDVIFRASHDGGETFADQVTIAHSDVEVGNSSDFLELGPPKIHAHGDDVYVVWSDVYHVFFSASHDKGITFDSPVVLASGSRTKGQVADVYVSGSDEHVHVGWQLYAGSSDGVFVRSSHDRGTTFAPSVNVSNNEGAWILQMLSSEENVYLSWQQSTRFGGSSIAFVSSNDNGMTYSEPKLLGGVAANSGAGPVMAASSSDVYVLWGGFYMSLAVSHDGGRNFEPVTTLATESGSFPLVSAAEGNVYVAWTTENLYSSNTWLKSSSDRGTTFTELAAILEDHPDVARSMTASGDSAFVVWGGGEVSLMKVAG